MFKKNLYLKALAVSSDDTDEESGPPMDGMAYLKQVIKVCYMPAAFQIRKLLAVRRMHIFVVVTPQDKSPVTSKN